MPSVSHFNYLRISRATTRFTTLSYRGAALLLFFFGVSHSFSSAFAKDLTQRLGLGYRDSLSFSLPSLAVQYYPNADYGVFSSLGIDTEEKNSRFAFAFGVRKIIFKEENLNFFFGGALALANVDNGVEKKSGFEMAATVGSEFFLQGLDSLGFNVETGFGVSNLSKVRFRTLGDSFVKSGIIFYF